MAWIRGHCLWIRLGRESQRQVFVVRRKLGNAVVRNRLKRRLRVLCRESAAHLSLVILPCPLAVDAKYSQLGLELKRLLAKLEQET